MVLLKRVLYLRPDEFCPLGRPAYRVQIEDVKDTGISGADMKRIETVLLVFTVCIMSRLRNWLSELSLISGFIG